MTEDTPRVERGEPVGRDAVLDRLERVNTLLAGVVDEQDANLREWDALHTRAHSLSSERDRLVQKLSSYLDESVGA